MTAKSLRKGVFLFVLNYSKHVLLGGCCILWLLVAGVQGVVFASTDVPGLPEGEVTLEGRVREQMGSQEGRQTVRLQQVTACTHRCADDQSIPLFVEVSMNAFPRVTVGEVIRVTCDLTPRDRIARGTFRYDRYLAKERVSAVCRGYGWPRVVRKERTARSQLIHWRDTYAQLIRRHTSEPHAALLEGLLYGARSTLPETVQEQFRRTGTMHIVAVSGYNVTLVASALMTALTATVLKRQQAFLVVLAGVAMFVVVAGADSAVVRAGMMGSLVLVSRQVGRPRVAVLLFLLTASLMVAVNPWVFVDDVGFQLSFAAAAGLVWLAPKLSTYLAWLPRAGGLRASLAETLAAIVATLPLMVLRFRQVSLVAPLANIFIVPLVPIAMLLGWAGTLVAAVGELLRLPWIGDLAMLPSTAVLEVMLLLIRAFAELPFLSW